MAFSIGNREEQVCLPKVETASTSVREIHQPSSLENKQFFHSSGRKHYPLKISAIAISFLGKTILKKSETITCQQYTTASFLKTLQSGFTSGHRIEIVFIATQPIIIIERSLILPYTAIRRGLISQKYCIYKVEILHNGTCIVLFEAKLRMVDNGIFCPSLCSWGPRLYP